MLTKEIAPNVYHLSLGFVNVFLIAVEELTLIDAGIQGSDRKIFQAIRELGCQPTDLRHILITHLHEDHVGSLPALQKESKARVYMHSLDAISYLEGYTMRSIEPSPGIVNQFIVRSMGSKKPQAKNTDLAPIHQMLSGGEQIPLTGGITAIHTPGHTTGHLAYYLPAAGGILFLGDAASHMTRLGYSFLYENFALGKETLNKIGQMNFNTACFSHGRAIIGRASEKISLRFSE